MKLTRALQTSLARRIAFLIVLACVSGCLSFPSVPGPGETPKGQPVVEGARGPLSPRKSAAIIENLKDRSGAADILERHVALEQAVAGRPLVAGNKVTLLEDGPVTYKSMFEAIRAARDHINLETYIFEDDEIGQRFAEALLDKQAHGVQVNVMYDSVGSIKTPRDFFDRMRQAGIRVLEFGPVNPLQGRRGYALTHRDHRKVLIADGRVAFVGGLNISSVYASSSRGASLSGSSLSRDAQKGGDESGIPWRDTHARIEGPVVRDFQQLFLDTWEKQRGDALPKRNYYAEPKNAGTELVRAIGSDADDASNPMYVTLVSAINNAEKTIEITVAYFLPDPQLLDALTGASRRGVDVRLVMPSRSDSWAPFNAGRARYDTLLRAGVKIYERREALLHAKTVLIDDVWSTVGSTNLDPLSFLHNDEINAVILGYDFGRQMRAMFERDAEHSNPITLEQWRHRPISSRVKELAARLWEYWM